MCTIEKQLKQYDPNFVQLAYQARFRRQVVRQTIRGTQVLTMFIDEHGCELFEVSTIQMDGLSCSHWQTVLRDEDVSFTEFNDDLSQPIELNHDRVCAVLMRFAHHTIDVI